VLKGVIDGGAAVARQAADSVLAAGVVLRVDERLQFVCHVGLVLLAAVVDPVGVPAERPAERRDTTLTFLLATKPNRQTNISWARAPRVLRADGCTTGSDQSKFPCSAIEFSLDS
jgi:hypothetical protein